MGGEPLINGNPKVECFSTNFSESESFHSCIVGQQSSFKDGFHFFHGRGGSPLINGNPKVAYFSTHFSESESFHTSIVGQQSSFKDGFHFIHGRGTPL